MLVNYLICLIFLEKAFQDYENAKTIIDHFYLKIGNQEKKQ